MDLQAIQNDVSHLIQDPSKDVAPDGTGSDTLLNTMINQAYSDLINEMETVGSLYNMALSAPVVTIPVSSIPREYDLLSSSDVSPNASDIRKVVDVVRTDGSVDYSIPIVAYAERNRWMGRPFGRSIRTPTTAVYFYRQVDTSDMTSAGVWVMGFVKSEPVASRTYQVRYLPTITDLSALSDVPQQVPEHWHRVIAVRAALLIKIQENRDATGIGLLYAEQLQRMKDDLSSPLTPSRVQPL